MMDSLDRTFAALADPTRRAILAMLLEDDMAVTDVAHPFDMSLAAVSKHLGILSRAGLISQERRGRLIWCKVEVDALWPASLWIQSFGGFDPIDLDSYERFLESRQLLAPGRGSENETDDGDDDHDDTHEIDDTIHKDLLFHSTLRNT